MKLGDESLFAWVTGQPNDTDPGELHSILLNCSATCDTQRDSAFRRMAEVNHETFTFQALRLYSRESIRIIFNGSQSQRPQARCI